MSAQFATTEDEARALVAQAMRVDSRVNHFGIGAYDESRITRAYGAHVVEFRNYENRKRLARSLDEVQAAADWIKLQERTAKFNEHHDSYGYKHHVERWLRGRGISQYVANGSFIAAAIGLGWDHEDNLPNARFQFAERTIREPGCHQQLGYRVYFIQAGNEAVKIGYSLDVAKRLDQLRTGNHLPLELLAAIDVDGPAAAQALEKELHARLVRFRLEGEWFEPSRELFMAIERLKRGAR